VGLARQRPESKNDNGLLQLRGGPDGTVALGRRGENGPRSFSDLEFLFQFDFPGSGEINWKEILRILEKYETLHGGRLEDLEQLSC
jgi:hypothetical protein